MKKILPVLLLAATLSAVEPLSNLLKPAKVKDTISYFMVGAAAPVQQNAMDAIAPNLSYGVRHFSGIHAKDYFVSAGANQHTQTLSGQYSFFFFPITAQGFGKTHSSFYIGAGLSAGVTHLSRSFAQKDRDWANKLEIERQIKAENAKNPIRIAEITDKVEKNQSLRRITPVLDLPLTVGYQFANTNFVQLQFSTLALAQNRYYNLPGNGIYATLNYGFGF
ncbi:MAG TPA: hypothetical protein VHL30_03845 [Chlamydiales bacterium]|jgi:hypothetical protein|nr:hypothetical protein [Chlamydiales bacterium]